MDLPLLALLALLAPLTLHSILSATVLTTFSSREAALFPRLWHCIACYIRIFKFLTSSKLWPGLVDRPGGARGVCTTLDPIGHRPNAHTSVHSREPLGRPILSVVEAPPMLFARR